MERKRDGIRDKFVFIISIILLWSSFYILPLYAAGNSPAHAVNDLKLISNYINQVDSSTIDNDIEILALANDFTIVGDTNNALKILSELKGKHLQAAALYYQYGNYDKTHEIALSYLPDSGFINLTAVYLLALCSRSDDSMAVDYWRKLAVSPVDVYRYKAYLKLAEYYYGDGKIDSSMIMLNKISPSALKNSERIDYYFLKIKLFYYLHDFSNALENLKLALSVETLSEYKKGVISFAEDSLYPSLNSDQVLELIDIFKRKRHYSTGLKFFQGIERSDSTDLVISWYYLGMKKYSRAAKNFSSLTKSPSESIRMEACYGAAICNYRRGLRVKGVSGLLRFTEKYPESPIVPRALFIAGDFYQKSNLEKSINILKTLTSEYSGSKYYARSLFLLGKSYLKLGHGYLANSAFSSYNRNDEFADLFDYWAFKTMPDDTLKIKQILLRRNPTFYSSIAGDIIGSSGPDSNLTYDVFINSFLKQVEQFLNWRVKKRNISSTQLQYVDSLFYYGLIEEAKQQLIIIDRNNTNLHNKLAIVKKSYRLHFDRVFYDVLDRFKTDLQKWGFSYSNDTWIRLNYPVLYKDLISRYAGETDPYLALSVIRRESRFDSDAVSNVGALGLMQLMPATAAQMNRTKKISGEALFKPGYNIKLGCKYLNWLKKRLAKEEVIISAYNAGPSAARRWKKQAGTDIETYIETIGYEQSRNYTRGVMGDYLWYKTIWPGEFNE